MWPQETGLPILRPFPTARAQWNMSREKKNRRTNRFDKLEIILTRSPRVVGAREV